MSWNELRHPDDLQGMLEHSYTQPCFIFKHSTRCSISHVALRRVDKSNVMKELSSRWFLVNVIAQRPISNEIEAKLGIRHESPQLILVVNGQAVWDNSHLGIIPNELPDVLAKYSIH